MPGSLLLARCGHRRAPGPPPALRNGTVGPTEPQAQAFPVGFLPAGTRGPSQPEFPSALLACQPQSPSSGRSFCRVNWFLTQRQPSPDNRWRVPGLRGNEGHFLPVTELSWREQGSSFLCWDEAVAAHGTCDRTAHQAVLAPSLLPASARWGQTSLLGERAGCSNPSVLTHGGAETQKRQWPRSENPSPTVRRAEPSWTSDPESAGLHNGGSVSTRSLTRFRR